MKTIFIAIFVLLAVLQKNSCNAQSHDIEWGIRGPTDRLLHREISSKDYSPLRVISQDVEYTGANGSFITYIKCKDQYTNGKGGYATLKAGGINERDVTIHLKSQRNHGFNFIIEIYGK